MKMGYRRRFNRSGFGYGYGRGYAPGYDRGYGRGYSAYVDPTKCARFPDLPRWWWANPAYEGAPVLPVPTASSERDYLEGSMKGLEQELADIKKRLAELSTTDKSE